MYELMTDRGEVLGRFKTYASALSGAENLAGLNGVVGHDGDLSDGGDRTLIWASESDADDDDGARAIGSIRRSFHA